MLPAEGHNAIWLQRSRNALMASRQAGGGGGWGMRGGHAGDGNVINGSGAAVRTVGKTKKKKLVMEEGGRRKNGDDHEMESN